MKALFSIGTLLLAVAWGALGVRQASAQGSVESDRAALVALYDATDGDNWHDNTNWKSDKPLRDWYGIFTNGDGGPVIWIQLPDNNLSGSIPPEIGNLVNLVHLNLNCSEVDFYGDGKKLSPCSLSGSIPAEIGNLTNLQILYLGNNSLSGIIPPEIGNLTNLRELLLHRNNFNGKLPEEIGKLVNLEFLTLYNNHNISGNIPAEIGRLKNLRNLSHGCSTHDLFGDGRALPPCSLSGSIPIEISNLTNLENLSLSHNKFSGSIPSELAKLTNLRSMGLASNMLSGTIPSELGKLTKLRYLYLWSNMLSGTIPSELGNLHELQSLFLATNNLYGSVPLSFENLTSLQYFKVNAAYNNRNNICLPVGLTNWHNNIFSTDRYPPLAICSFDQVGSGGVPNFIPTSSESEELPLAFSLEQNYPNPFNPSTTIEYALDAPGYVELAVYDMAGAMVATLVNEYQPAGRQAVSWRSDVPSGSYLYRLVANGRSITRYMTLVR